jgi:cyclase
MSSSLLNSRLIPVLTKSGKRLIKTVNFQDRNYIGDPINTVKILNDMMIDEILILDIDVSRLHLPIDFGYLERIATNCFSPLAYGGGISSVDDARRLFSLGFEKLVFNTMLFENPRLIEEISSEFGSQSVIASVDLTDYQQGQLSVQNHSDKFETLDFFVEWLKNLCSTGIGELLITDVTREGTFLGLNIDLISKIGPSIEVPLIIHGGVNSLQNALDALVAGADAVGVGSLFVYDGPRRAVLLNYPNQNELVDLGLR